MSTIGKTPLHTMTLMSPTEFWNDSCSVADLKYAIDNGAVGGTSNPTIVGSVLKKEIDIWRPAIVSLIEEHPSATEDEIAWKIMEMITVNAAKQLMPIFTESNGRNGRLSIQTNAKYYRNANAIVEQAVYFDSLYPNNNIKLPVTKAGVEAIEELTYRGVNINATISFTLPQAIAVAEAVERGLSRRQKEGKDISTMSPVCTLMVGRLDDWLKVQVAKKGIITEPGYLEWAGVAVAKKAYQIYKKRGYRTRLLIAAFRNHYHWSEFIGAEMSLTIPPDWQKKYNASDVEVKNRIDNEVDPQIIAGLQAKFPDFNRAYDENGMKPEEFELFGSTRRTLLSFIESYADLLKLIRHIMISDPDVKGE
ncbi:transaldolase family protein [Parabacteroides sp. PF5-6]|uniref:transaldolase family protein n=1 Tax=Parabacteroides sp. PF5-6 TaxID=1742403 RepID=UPI0024061FFA|nr:transaldolase family protein [Parabacteroides sp. PF5-6]MDF9828740.1 transaldolase [Parabacteroides sp. PF5-6]